MKQKKWKGWMAIMLCAALFAGCSGGGTPATTSAPTQNENSEPSEVITTPTEATTTPTDAPVEDRLPAVEEGCIRMYYDDRLSVAALGEENAAVEIIGQDVRSTAVGNGEKDAAVVMCQDGTLIAVGIGTAQITVGDQAYQVEVEAAPISLMMIIGHSIGAGATGVPAQSVLCPAGQVYSTHYQDLTREDAPGVGIGYAAANRPADIDAFTAAGAGVPGEGSGLALRWNAITGEKLWLLNAAKGGTCLNEWEQGTEHYQKSVKMFQYAQAVLTNEIAAGHYRLKDMAIIYHSGANFGYKNVTFTDELGQKWYRSLWNGLKQELSMDMDGDGTEETVSAMGFVPIWTESGRKTYADDKPSNYYMAASDQFPDMFMASDATKVWSSSSGLKAFPAIDYETHGEAVAVPTTVAQLYSDGVHLNQSVYNALGMDIAQNLFSYLRTYRPVQSISFQKPDGNKIYDDVTLDGVGDFIRLIPLTEPLTVSDLTVTLTDNLTMAYPGTIMAVESGEGMITVSQGDRVLAQIAVLVED